MSFMKTLATVAVGFAAAKGMDQYKKMGGMAGMQNMMQGSGGAAGMGDQLASMADKMGIPGGGKAVQDMMSNFGLGGAGGAGGSGSSGAAAGMAGLGGLMSAFGGAAAASGGQMDELLGGVFANTPVSVAAEQNAKLMIRAMIQAAKADGEIDAQEREKILDALKDAPAEEVAYVKEQLASPVDVMGLAQDTGDAMKAQVYATSLTAVKVDSDAERVYLTQLASALGLDKTMQDQVHRAMGVATL